MNHPLRVVLVGCGGITGTWLEALKGMPDVSVVGLVDLQADAAERRKEEYGLTEARTGTDLGKMLDVCRPDAVFDCTVPAARASVVLAALAHGCHVLSENPMAASMAEARQLVEASRQAGRVFAIMQNRRYDPRLRAIRGFLDAGEIGKVTTVNGDFYLGAHFGGFRDEMRHPLLFDMAVHSFDQARLLSGGTLAAVYCQEWNPRGSWYAHGASAIVIFEMSNGAVYTYRGSWCAEGLNTSWECDWRIVGTRGSIRWDGGDQVRAQRVAGDEGFIRPMLDLDLPMAARGESTGHARCIRDFVDSVRAGKEPETICTDNINSLAMVLGAIESAETGRKVFL